MKPACCVLSSRDYSMLLAVICCGFISHLIGRETINIPEFFSGVHGFTGKTVIKTTIIIYMLVRWKYIVHNAIVCVYPACLIDLVHTPESTCDITTRWQCLKYCKLLLTWAPPVIGPSTCTQGSYRSWKTWKVMEFRSFIFQAWRVMEFNCQSLKVMENLSFAW